jgi:hypothetical protein
MVIAVRCHRCGTEAGPGKTLRRLTEDEARCPQCHEVRDPEVTNLVRGGEPYADWPLQRLCVPPLDIVEVRTSSGPAWYELTGDLADLPEAFR